MLDDKSINFTKIIEKINYLNTNIDIRKELSENGKKEVDGMGVDRIFEKISSFNKI